MIRIIVNSVSFYTTKRAILESRVGDNLILNGYLRKVYLEIIQNKHAGMATSSAHFNPMCRELYDIQISL